MLILFEYVSKLPHASEREAIGLLVSQAEREERAALFLFVLLPTSTTTTHFSPPCSPRTPSPNRRRLPSPTTRLFPPGSMPFLTVPLELVVSREAGPTLARTTSPGVSGESFSSMSISLPFCVYLSCTSRHGTSLSPVAAETGRWRLERPSAHVKSRRESERDMMKGRANKRGRKQGKRRKCALLTSYND